MLRALHSPYGMVRFMPTGGITPTNLADYLACPSVFAVFGHAAGLVSSAC